MDQKRFGMFLIMLSKALIYPRQTAESKMQCKGDSDSIRRGQIQGSHDQVSLLVRKLPLLAVTPQKHKGQT